MFALQTNDSSTLHLAAAGGHSSVVRALLEAGASPTDENGVKPRTCFYSDVQYESSR